MVRSFFSAAAIAVLVIANLLTPITASARRCPEEPPKTLLGLYRSSEAIYVARFDRVDQETVVEDEADYSIVETKQRFDISSTLKGETRKFVVLSNREYRSKTAEEPGDAEYEEFEGIYDGETANLGDVKAGDPVMLFLTFDEERDETDEAEVRAPERSKDLVLTDYRKAVKKLSDDDMAIYEARIRELGSIFAREKVNDSEIVAWLVRCIEDPATRWEGAFELLQSFQELEWRDRLKREREERIAKGEDVDEEVALDEGSTDEHGKPVDTTQYARLLTSSQKDRLTRIVLDRESDDPDEGNEKPSKLTSTDRVLIDLVGKWGDSRLAVMLLDQLRNSPDVPYRNSGLMTTIASVLKDEELSGIADKYAAIYGQDDQTAEEEVSDGPPAGDSVEQTEGEVIPDLGEEPEGGSETSETTGGDGVEKPVKPRPTYGEMRADLMARFIARGDAVIAGQDEEQVAEYAR